MLWSVIMTRGNKEQTAASILGSRWYHLTVYYMITHSIPRGVMLSPSISHLEMMKEMQCCGVALQLRQLRFLNCHNKIVKRILQKYYRNTSLSWAYSSFHKVWVTADWWCVAFLFLFSLGVHVFSICYQVLPSDDYRCCESQKREKLLSACFFFLIMIFSCMLDQCCPECHDLPNVTKSWQCYVLVNLLFTKKWPLSVLLSSLTDSWNLISELMHNLWDSILTGDDVQVIVCFTFLWLFINRGMGWLELGCWAFWNVVLFS